MVRVFPARTADSAWKRAVRSLLDPDTSRIHVGRGNRETRELLHSVFEVDDPRQRWVLSRRPAINPAFALAEVVWILAGRNDSAFLNHWNPGLPKYQGLGSEYHGAYGFRIRKHYGLDQLDRVFKALRGNPSTRQACLLIWDPALDLPLEDGTEASADIPCNVCSLIKVREDKLEWTQVMRSNDIVLGFPHNVVQFTSLQEILAGWLGVGLGHYVHWSDSLHAYTREDTYPLLEDLPAVDIPDNTDDLMTSRETFDDFFPDLELAMERLATEELSHKDMIELVEKHGKFPAAYRNILRIAAADSARRSDALDLAYMIADNCTNPTLRLALDAWFKRWVCTN